MITRRLDYTKPYRGVLYLRMSSDKQNKRSPDQQEAEIRGLIARLKLHWVIVEVYLKGHVRGGPGEYAVEQLERVSHSPA